MDASKIQKTSCIERIQQLSVMRVAACIAIVVLHTVFAANEYFNDSISSADNIVSRIIENNMMWAVPLFVMVTGVLQLNHKKSLTLRKLFGKYILRIIYALIICSVLFRVFDIVMDHEPLTLMNLLKAFSELITASGWGHLWYLYLLIGLYILMPFYRTIMEQCSDMQLKYLVGVFLLFLSVIPMIESFGLHIGFYISESIIYPLYLMMGHLIYENRVRIARKTGIMMLIISTVLLIGLDIVKYSCGLNVPSAWFGYSSPMVIAQTIGVFTLINSKNGYEKASRKIINSIDACSFGIYLFHMVFVRALFRYGQFNPYEYFAPVSIPICIVGIFALSYTTVIVLKKIPILKAII